MKTVTALFLCAIAAWAQPLAVTHVTVVDVEAGRDMANMTVVVDGERIISVGPASKARVPRGAQIVNGRGKYLIPGLWDMHVHMMSLHPPDSNDPAPREFYAPHFLANGITGVRSMFDSLPALRKLSAPRIVTSGPILDGPYPYWQGSIACSNAEQARAAVRRLKAEGVDFLKVYSGLPKETYLAIADEARRAELSFAGHLPNSVTAAEASDAGQKSLEHLTGLTNDQPVLYARLVKNGTWVTPTLTVLRSTAYYTDPEYTKDDRITLLPPLVQRYWKTGWSWIGKEQEAERKQRFARRLELVAEMHRAGVRILAGSDTPNPYVFPGTSLHDELELIVKAGLTPAEALRCATLRPAEFLGMEDRLGTIAKGKLADLVLLSGDPLADIANTRRIEMVLLGGRVVVRKSTPGRVGRTPKRSASHGAGRFEAPWRTGELRCPIC